MLTIRKSVTLAKLCNHSHYRRTSYWLKLVAAKPDWQDRKDPTTRRLLFRSVASSAENSEDALPEDVADMRSRMGRLHNVDPTKGVALADYRRSNYDIDEYSAAFLDDHVVEDDSNQVGSSVDGLRKSLRKDKNVDVVVNTYYGHVRFDSMNKPKPALRQASGETEDVQEEIPSVKIVKDGRRVFSINEAEENEMMDVHSCEDVGVEDMCQTSSQIESQIPELKMDDFDRQFEDSPHKESGGIVAESSTMNSASDHELNVIDEQYFGNLFYCEEQKGAHKSREGEEQSIVVNNTAPNNEMHDRKPNLFDEQYFDNILLQDNVKFSPKNMAKTVHDMSETLDVKPSVYDEQYFGDVLEQGGDRQQSSVDNSESVENRCRQTDHVDSIDHRPKTTGTNEEQLSMIEEQYFGSYVQGNVPQEAQATDDSCNIGLKHLGQVSNFKTDYQYHHSSQAGNESRSQQRSQVEPTENIVTPFFGSEPVWKEVEDMIKESAMEEDSTVVVEPITCREVKARTRPRADVESPKTAYDVAMKIRQEQRQKQSPDEKQKSQIVLPKYRKWSGRLDSHGFRILTDQVINVQQLTQEQVLLILKDSIIHEDDKLLVIDKPYGLPSHGGPGVHHSVGKLLEPFAKKIDRTGLLQTLYLVHRLDKETTGVMVLAKSLQVAEFLLAMFKKRQIVKRYWVITKSVPEPQQGVIDIPITEDIVGHRYRMSLRPMIKADGRPVRPSPAKGEVYEAVTNYRVMTDNGSAALVECCPETGVKHQIRCHLAFGLNTPILGDHKYSHYSKMAPQKLHPEMLQMLGVRQAKVRHVPMHLHAKAIVLPEWTNGHNLFLSARLPPHFVQNMKWLKLKPPS